MRTLSDSPALLSPCDSLKLARHLASIGLRRLKRERYTYILLLQSLERTAFLHGSEADRDALRGLLQPFWAGEVSFRCNYPNYLCGGNASAAALFHGLAPEARELVAAQAEAFLTAPRDRDGIVCRPDTPAQEKIWIDSAWAVSPFALHAGLALDRPDLVDEAVFQTLTMVEVLRDPDGGLLHQGRGFQGPGVLSQDHWSRGNGWAVLALAALAEDLPPDHPRHGDGQDAFVGLLRACLAWAGPEGLWHQEMTRPDSFVETSGSWMILHGLAVALRRGLLGGAEAEPARAALERGLRASLAYVGLDGSLHHTCAGCCCPGDGSIEAYLVRPHRINDPHSFGAAVLAFAEAASLGIRSLEPL